MQNSINTELRNWKGRHRFHLIHETGFSAGGSNPNFGCPTSRQPVLPRRRTLPRPWFRRMNRVFRRWLRLIRAVRHPGAKQDRAPLSAVVGRKRWIREMRNEILWFDFEARKVGLVKRNCHFYVNTNVILNLKSTEITFFFFSFFF